MATKNNKSKPDMCNISGEMLAAQNNNKIMATPSASGFEYQRRGGGGETMRSEVFKTQANATHFTNAHKGIALDIVSSINSSGGGGGGGDMESAAPPKYSERLQERYVWEMRARSPNVTPASTVLNSPDLTTDLYSMNQHNNSMRHHQIHVGRSPESQFEHNNIVPQDLNSSSNLRDGEIVVFDDITTNWMNKASLSQDTKDSFTCLQQTNDDVLKVTKMIGQLPIAEYEGSPRRFGNQSKPKQQQQQQQQHIMGSGSSAYPKRPPGFPQRISPTAITKQQQQQHDIAQQLQQQEVSNRQHQYNIIQYLPTMPITNSTSDKNETIENLIDIDNEGVNNAHDGKVKTPTFDYLYEFSETRKVLEEFFKGNPDDGKRFADFTEKSEDFGSCATQQDSSRELEEQKFCTEVNYVGQRLARIPKEELTLVHRSPKKQSCDNAYNEQNDIELYIDSNSRSSDTELDANVRRNSRNFTLSPETTDYDSNCGDLDSLSNDINCTTDYGKLYTSMPVLEDGLSSGHASDTDINAATTAAASVQAVTGDKEAEVSETNDENLIVQNGRLKQMQQQFQEQCAENNDYNKNFTKDVNEEDVLAVAVAVNSINEFPLNSVQEKDPSKVGCCNDFINDGVQNGQNISLNSATEVQKVAPTSSLQEVQLFPMRPKIRSTRSKPQREPIELQEAMKEIRSALQRAKTQPEKLKFCDEVLPPGPDSPIWVLRKNTIGNYNHAAYNKINRPREEEELDTDLETDRLLGQHRIEDQGFSDDKTIWQKIGEISNDQSPSNTDMTMLTTNSSSIKPHTFVSATIRQGIGTSLTPTSPDHKIMDDGNETMLPLSEEMQFIESPTRSIKSTKSLKKPDGSDKKNKSRNKETHLDPEVLIEGVLFRARYLGSTQLVCEGQPTKSTRMMQAEEAVSRIKAPEGESQPSTEVDLFISTEKIMVLNTDLKEIMMDHALRTISYIADIGDLVVLMARRRFVPSDSCSSDAEINAGEVENKDNNKENSTCGKLNRTPKMICHVFESDEAQFIAQSIGQAFQVAYMEFLKANGIEDHTFVKEMDYQEVLNSQEIFGDELEIFAKKELQKEVVVPKAKGEILGVVIVESGWGSMLPTVVIANLMSTGAAARCGQLNIGDQLIAINGMSLVGLPLSTCQNYIRNARNQTAVKFTVVPCPPVVEVKIKRPNTKYQLGFSVQNGVICSLLRGGIAERGGVRVGHRIIEINNQSVVAVPHEKIVNLLATSVGEILMKTMPTSMFRLLTGQENPIYI